MSMMVMCDRCKKVMYTDSRNDKGDYASIQLTHGNELIYFHLCSECHKELRELFMKDLILEG